MPHPATPAVCQSNLLPPSASADTAPTGHITDTYVTQTPGERSVRTYPHPSSLETHESNAHFACVLSSSYQRHRHESWQPLRLRTYATLETVQTSPKVLDRFRLCGDAAMVEQHIPRPNFFRIRCFKCRSRFCHPCQRERSAIIQHNLQWLAHKSGRNLSHLTLTLAHNDRCLKSELKRLTGSFRDLRRLLPWKRAVTAGAWTIEVKVGEDGRWHPHIHCLIENTYLEQGWLSQAWKAVTGDSTQVWIKRIDAHGGARYITKYISKPLHKSVLADNARFEEFVLAMKGTRSCATFGTWHGCPLAEREQDEDLLGSPFDRSPTQWRTLCTFDELAARIRKRRPRSTRAGRGFTFAPQRTVPLTRLNDILAGVYAPITIILDEKAHRFLAHLARIAGVDTDEMAKQLVLTSLTLEAEILTDVLNAEEPINQGPSMQESSTDNTLSAAELEQAAAEKLNLTNQGEM